MERLLSGAPVSVPKEFNRANENAHRNYIEGELADTYRKSSNVVIPYGFNLGFNGTNGEQVVLVYESGVFKINIDGATVVSFATTAALTALTAAYQAADTTLQSNITSEASTRASADSTLASSITSLTSAYQSADTTLQANITSEASTRASADTAIASSVTSLTATVGTNTANITTNAAAIATVDGKLSASYGLTVDANGRIASMKLLSNGTTSSVKFTASTFSIYDGSSDVAMFEVAGGSAYVAGSKVRTESMTANSVTVADDDETDAGVNVGSSWVSVASVDLTTVDAASRALVMFSAYIESSADGSLMDARIKRDSTVIWGPKSIAGDPPTLDFETPVDGNVSYTPPFAGMVSFFDTDVPGSAATYTYSVELRVAGSVSSPWVASFRRMFGMAFKR